MATDPEAFRVSVAEAFTAAFNKDPDWLSSREPERAQVDDPGGAYEPLKPKPTIRSPRLRSDQEQAAATPQATPVVASTDEIVVRHDAEHDARIRRELKEAVDSPVPTSPTPGPDAPRDVPTTASEHSRSTHQDDLSDTSTQYQPLLDSRTGCIDPTRSSFPTDLFAATPDLPDGSPKKARHFRKLLGEALASAANAIAKPVVPGDTKAELQKEMDLCDAFEKAANHAEKVLKHLHYERSTPELRHATKTYDLISALLFQLKRHHFTASAPHALKLCIDAGEAKIKTWAKGIAENRAGSSFTATHFSLDFLTKHAPFQGSVGGSKSYTVFVDDTGDIDIWPSKGFKARFGGGLPLFGDGLTISLGFNRTWSGEGHLVEAETYRDAAALHVMKQIQARPSATRNPVQAPAGRVLRWAAQIGREHVPDQVPAQYHFRKMEKDQQCMLFFYADAIDTLNGNTKFTDLITTTYPGLDTVVRSGYEKRPYQPLQNTFPRVVVDGNLYSTSFDVLGSIGETNDDAVVTPKWGTGLVGRYDLLDIPLAYKPDPHKLMSSLSTVRQSNMVFAKLNALSSEKAQARLTAYRSVDDKLAQAGRAAKPDDAPCGDWPEPFQDTIRDPSGAKARALKDVCEGIRHTYARMAYLASWTMCDPKDANVPPALEERLQRYRLESFRRIDAEVWGSKYPGGSRAALKDPVAFIARSHDALSMALGKAEMHLRLLQRHLPCDERDALASAWRACHEAKLTVEYAGLPIQRNRLAQYSLLKANGNFKRHHGSVTVSAAAGAPINLVQATQQTPTAPGAETYHGAGAFTADTSMNSVSARARVTYQRATMQPRGSRMGHFIEIPVSVSAGAGTALVLTEALIAAARAKFGKSIANYMSDLQLASQLRGMVLGFGGGCDVLTKLHRPEGCDKYSLQYVRIVINRVASTSLGAAVPGIDLGAWAFKVGLTTSDASSHVLVQVNGPDVSNLIMQHHHLSAALQEVKALEESGGQAPDEWLHEQTPFDKNRLRENPLMARICSNPVVLCGWFGFKSTILSNIIKYKEFQDNKDDPATLERLQKTNQFCKFGLPPYKRIAEDLATTRAYWPDEADRAGGPVFGDIPLDWTDEDLKRFERTLDDESGVEGLVKFYGAEGRGLLLKFDEIIRATKVLDDATGVHAGDPDLKNIGFRVDVDPHEAGVDATAGQKGRNALRRLARIGADAPTWGAVGDLPDVDSTVNDNLDKNLRQRRAKTPPKTAKTPASSRRDDMRRAQSPAKVEPVRPISGSSVDPDSSTVIRDNTAAYGANRPATTSRLENAGLRVISNQGEGNNCLIISLIQHATGEYEKSHLADAIAVRNQLLEAVASAELVLEGALDFNDPLHSDTAGDTDGARIVRWLIDRVFRDYAGHEDASRRPRVIFLDPGHEGYPIIRFEDRGRASEAVAIANWGDHFDAVTPVQGSNLLNGLVTASIGNEGANAGLNALLELRDAEPAAHN